MRWGNTFTYFTCDGCARDGCFGCRSSRFGRNRDAGAKGGDGVDAADDGGGGRGWFSSAYDCIAQTLGFGPTAADPLDECEKGEAGQDIRESADLWPFNVAALVLLLFVMSVASLCVEKDVGAAVNRCFYFCCGCVPLYGLYCAVDAMHWIVSVFYLCFRSYRGSSQNIITEPVVHDKCVPDLAACWAYAKQRAEEEEAAAAVALIQRGVVQRLQFDGSATAASVECLNLWCTCCCGPAQQHTQPLASASVTPSGATSCSGAGRGGVGVAPPHGGSGRSGKAAAAAPVIAFPDNVPPAAALYVAVTGSAAVTDANYPDAAFY